MKDKEKRMDDYDYSDWIRHQADIDFDFKWHILQMVALLFALIGLFFFVVHVFML